ncbi:dihydroorotase [Sphingopyxis sp. FD7]|nr:dihydroorotase [Sphingopyxis sp. FD7]
MAAARGDDIEKIAMIAAGGIGPFASGPKTVGGARKANVKAATRRIMDVTDQPIMSLAASMGEISAANRLGIVGKASRDLRCRTRHGGLLHKTGCTRSRPEERVRKARGGLAAPAGHLRYSRGAS